jgi:hypothetical protein
MMLFRSAPSPGIPFSLPFGSWQGEGAKVQRGECTRFVPVPQLFFSRRGAAKAARILDS